MTSKICPPAKWSAIPALDRNTTKALMFAPGCLPGTTDSNGACSTKDIRYTLTIPWDEFQARARKAPGGNLYWEGWVHADRKNPLAHWLLEQMAIRNRIIFRDRARGDKETVEHALGRGFLKKFGLVNIPIEPKPGETIDAFSKRGGHLFYPASNERHAFAPTKKKPRPIYRMAVKAPGEYDVRAPAMGLREGIENTENSQALAFLRLVDAKPKWLDDVDAVEIYASYNVPEERVYYTIRLAWTSKYQQVLNNITDKLFDPCGTLNQPEVRIARKVAAAVPATAPYAAGVETAAMICAGIDIGSALIADEPCTPRPAGGPGSIEEMLAKPVVLSAKYMRVDPPKKLPPPPPPPAPPPPKTVTPPPARPKQPPQTPPKQVTPAYPAGSIAWADPAVPGYLIAAVAPAGANVTHRVVARGVAAVPPGVRVVSRSEWERATLPWVQRRTSKIGIGAGIGAAVLAVVGAVVAARTGG